MWIENKAGVGLSGPAKIDWVKVLNNGRRLDYKNQRFQTLRGSGFKANYRDVETGDPYWISGCRKDGRDALYPTSVEIDEDALHEYWVNTRKQPHNMALRHLKAMSKY